METLILPNTDLVGSRLIAGCMGLGGGWDAGTILNASHENQARAFIDTALDLGINFFDHANIYAVGRAEEVFGRILKEKPTLRGQIILQSKVGIRWANDPAGTTQRFDFSCGHIIEATEAILRRLGISYLDILLLHRPDPLMEGEEVARLLPTLNKRARLDISEFRTRTASRWTTCSTSARSSRRQSAGNESAA